MTEPYGYDDSAEFAQDVVTWRRMITWEVRRLHMELEETRQAIPARQAWWTPYLIPLLAGLIAGYIGIVHTLALNTQHEVQRIAAIQYQRSSLAPDIEDLKRRVLTNEQMAQRVPSIEARLVEIIQKLDRLVERRQYPAKEDFR